MNRVFWRVLSQNTTTPFELIIIDNHSTDGSQDFFKELAQAKLGSQKKVVYVRNEQNQSYPQSQIQGMEKARYDVFCFLNNDIWMPLDWEKPFLAALKEDPKIILSPSGQEAQPTQRKSDSLKRKWKYCLWLSKIWAFGLGKSEEERLMRSLSMMYGDLDEFKSPTDSKSSCMAGIKGDSVIMHREVLKYLQPWDLEIQAADWHLYLQAASLHEKDPSFPLPRVLLNSYIHHFGRYSARQKYEPLPPDVKFKSIEEVWPAETVQRLWWGYHLER